MQRCWWVWLLALALVPDSAKANVKPDDLCGEGMVLQQKAKANIWGTADPNEAVTVTFRGKTVKTAADAAGKWLVAVESGAAGGPFEMTIEGNNKIEYKDVLVGEVWVCSGQSNMEWSVNACDEADRSSASKAEPNSNLRLFAVAKTPMPSPKVATTGKWVSANSKVVGNWTACGYFFGRLINSKLNVPVGLIQTAWGGTRAEAWTSLTKLHSDPDFSHEKTKEKNPGPNDAAALYNGMIYPVLNYGIKGAIWYQGESNAGQAYKYRKLFPLMIENWRKDFKQGDFPFYFVQLAPFNRVPAQPGESDWAELREAQSMTLKLKNTGQAVITDLGDEIDIHPTPKQPVGERLAYIALARDYGQKLVYSGPTFDKVEIKDGKAYLSFQNVGGGLTTHALVKHPSRNKNVKDGYAYRVDPKVKDAPLVGFTICGSDKKFVVAEAKIEGDKVVVSSKDVSDPVAVRFGWANHPVVNLFNIEGLPASPFRTDSFPRLPAPPVKKKG